MESGFLAAPVGVSFEDEFVGGGLEPIDGGLGEEWVGHEGDALDRVPVAGHDRRCAAVPLDDELVDLGGVDRVESAEREVIQDEQVNAQKFADFRVVAVVEPGCLEAPEHGVGAFEVDAVAAPDRRVSRQRHGSGRVRLTSWGCGGGWC